MIASKLAFNGLKFSKNFNVSDNYYFQNFLLLISIDYFLVKIIHDNV